MKNVSPNDIANLVNFLLSDDADYINGENVSLNGGQRLFNFGFLKVDFIFCNALKEAAKVLPPIF